MGARRTRGPVLGRRGGPGTGPSPSPPQGPWAQHGPRRLRSPAGLHGPSAHRPGPRAQRCAFPTSWRGRQLRCRWGDSPTKPKFYIVKQTKRSNPTLALAKPSAAREPGTFLGGEPCNPGPLPPATCATRDGDTLSHPSSTHQLWLQGPTGCPRPFGVGSGHASQLVCPAPCEAPAARGTRPQPPQGPGLTQRPLPPTTVGAASALGALPH